PRTGGQQGVCNRRSGPTRAQEHHPLPGGRGKTEFQGTGKTGPVRVVPHGLSVVEDHGVDRSQSLRLGGEDIQMLQCQLFARMGDVQTVETEMGAARIRSPTASGGNLCSWMSMVR